MSSSSPTAIPQEIPVFQRLLQRYYRDGKAIQDDTASSHWKEFSSRFSVHSNGNKYALKGYGFGGSDNFKFISLINSFFGNSIQQLMLGLPHIREEVVHAKTIVKNMGLMFSQDAFRQVCTLRLLRDSLPFEEKPPEQIMVIGDGHGILSALIHDRYPSARIFLIDLGSVLTFQAYHLQHAFPDALQTLVDEDTDGVSVFNFCPADRLDALPLTPFDLAVNIVSMQEMNPSVTANYFSLLRRNATRYFYCCNRLEKHLIGGEISRFMEYPWLATDKHLVDELCPWHKWWFGRGRSPHVKLCGLPIPLLHEYDGPIWHRLTKLGATQINP